MNIGLRSLTLGLWSKPDMSKTQNPKPKTTLGDEREMESGLTFNQLICEFESRRPRLFQSTKHKAPFIYVGRSLTAERRTVTA
jgi:hypothetical protein